jgi:predicted RNA-binding Zn ribbon-like protein
MNEPWIFDRTGDHLALDFANTVSDRPLSPVDHLATYCDLVEFARQTGIVTDAGAQELLAQCRARPSDAARALLLAHTLRDALYELTFALAEGQPLPEHALASFNALVPHLRLGPSLQWTWAGDAGGLDAMLGPIVRAALEVLTTDLRHRVSRCRADTCQFVFLDCSKNRSRQWCSMGSCGNREKARRFHGRHRGPSGEAS